MVLEAAVALLTAAAFVAACGLIRVDPLDRLGQIAGLAGMALWFALAAIALVVVLVVAARRRGGAGFELASRLVCASVAGLATGVIGGGLLIALRGTSFGLNGRAGDVGLLALWATRLHRGLPEAIRPSYPPLAVHILHLYSDLVHQAPATALKHLEIAGVAASGPLVYLTWRLLLPPVWALAIGVVASLPLVEPYKPYPTLVLAVFLPIALVFLQALRDSPTWPVLRVARAGVAYGLGFGALCLLYSGWFQWSVPGLAVAALVVFPWRSPRNGFYLLGLTAALFLFVTKNYALRLLDDPTGIRDTYIYFDVKTEPLYIAMWRNDTPGTVGVWPPIGELGGVGLFTIALAIGLGAAIAQGRRKTVTIGLGAVMAGAWLLRFQYARKLWETKLVQLYPRTTPLILYCLLILTGYAIHDWLQRRQPPPAADRPPGASGMIGAVAGLLLFFGSAGSAIVNRYMPDSREPPSAGWLTWNAHRSRHRPPYQSHALPWIRRSSVPDTTPR